MTELFQVLPDVQVVIFGYDFVNFVQSLPLLVFVFVLDMVLPMPCTFQLHYSVVLDTNINSAFFEFNAYIHPNENYLIFSSFGRPDGVGGGDLYISRKDANGNWTPAQNLKEPINTPSLDYCPFVDLSNNVFYFTSERSAPVSDRLTDIEAFTAFSNQVLNGLGNIYRVNLDELAQ